MKAQTSKVPFLEDLRVGLHQVICDVIPRQILENIPSGSLHLKLKQVIKNITRYY